MRVAHWFLLALALFAPGAADAQEVLPLSFDLATARPAAAETGLPTDIVVTGQRMRGAVRGDVPPLVQLDERDIAAFGAGTIAELIEALSPEARSLGGGPPAVLVNGQRIASLAEIQDLPPEAVARIDVLPEEVALRYGYRADRRVVNIVLRSRFRAVTAEAAHGFATDGGRHTTQGSLNVARIGPEGRWSVNTRYQRAEALLESERPIEGGLGRFRTLLPRTERLTVTGSLTRDVFRGVPATLSASVETGTSQARLGPLPSSGAATPLRPLLRESESRAANVGVSLGGSLDEWQWLFAGSYDLSRTETWTEVARSSESPRQHRVRNDMRFAEGQLLLNGGLVALPAGNVEMSVKLAAESHLLLTQSTATGIGHDSRLFRAKGSGQGTVEIPLTGPGWLAGAGRLSAYLDLRVEPLSDFETLHRIGGSLRWAPFSALSVTAAMSKEGRAPEMQELGAPLLLTPNVRLFDFSAGETVDVERLNGGNRVLIVEQRRNTRLGLVVRPLTSENLSLAATYSRSRVRNPVAYLPTPTPEIEAAFPDRFLRNADGRLLRIDARPVNFARAERDQLRWGFSYSKRLPACSPRGVARKSETFWGSPSQRRPSGGAGARVDRCGVGRRSDRGF